MEKQSWLQEHLRTFVLPHLGCIPDPDSPTRLFTKEEMAVIKNIWRSAKQAAKGKMLVLPGRDVFIFEILARRENYPTYFLPACSRGSVRYFKDKLPENAFIFDTGFMGSIPRALEVDNFKLVSFADRHSQKQVFPHLTLSRSLALKIEATPKYWQTGRMVSKVDLTEARPFHSNPEDWELRQDFSHEDEFMRAAILTTQIYKDSSPSFINRPKPMGGGRYGTL